MADESALEALGRRRLHVGLALTGLVVLVYFGFVLVVAFRPASLATLLAPGLSWGIAAGAAVITFAWAVTGLYVHWANGAYDAEVARLRGGKEG